MKELKKTRWETYTEQKRLEKERNKPQLNLFTGDGGLVSMEGLESTRTLQDDYSTDKEKIDA